MTIVHSIEICGAAVAWCLVKDLIATELAQDLLQFVSIATVCDHMKLLGVNRALLKEGLKVLNKTKKFRFAGFIPGKKKVMD